MIPSEREQELVAMFDSFCKTVIRNYSRTLIRRKNNRPENNMEEPIEVLLDMWGTRDEYPSLSNTFVVDGETYSIESDTLYKALVSLPEQQRTVILLDFWDIYAEFNKLIDILFKCPCIRCRDSKLFQIF